MIGVMWAWDEPVCWREPIADLRVAEVNEVEPTFSQLVLRCDGCWLFIEFPVVPALAAAIDMVSMCRDLCCSLVTF